MSVLAACSRSAHESSSSDLPVALGAVNTTRTVDDEKQDNARGTVRAQSAGDEAEDQDEQNPMAYQYTVYSGDAFDIIDRLTPQCTACHRISTQGNARGAGPSLNGLKHYAGQRVEGLSAREYIKQSILNPSAHIVEECPTGPCVDVMVKTYPEQFEDGELDTLVNFLLSLDEDTR
jgi:hypothetical protein